MSTKHGDSIVDLDLHVNCACACDCQLIRIYMRMLTACSSSGLWRSMEYIMLMIVIALFPLSPPFPVAII